MHAERCGNVDHFLNRHIARRSSQYRSQTSQFELCLFGELIGRHPSVSHPLADVLRQIPVGSCVPMIVIGHWEIRRK